MNDSHMLIIVLKRNAFMYISLLIDSNKIIFFVFLWHTYRAGPHPTALLTFKFWRIGLRDVERLARHRDQARQALAHPRVWRRPLGDRKVRLQNIEKQVHIHDRDHGKCKRALYQKGDLLETKLGYRNTCIKNKIIYKSLKGHGNRKIDFFFYARFHI